MSEYLLKRKRKIYKVNPHKNNLCKSLITRRDTVSQCKSLIEGSSDYLIGLTRVSEPPGAGVFGWSRSRIRHFGPAPAPASPYIFVK